MLDLVSGIKSCRKCVESWESLMLTDPPRLEEHLITRALREGRSNRWIFVVRRGGHFRSLLLLGLN